MALKFQALKNKNTFTIYTNQFIFKQIKPTLKKTSCISENLKFLRSSFHTFKVRVSKYSPK